MVGAKYFTSLLTNGKWLTLWDKHKTKSSRRSPIHQNMSYKEAVGETTRTGASCTGHPSKISLLSKASEAAHQAITFSGGLEEWGVQRPAIVVRKPSLVVHTSVSRERIFAEFVSYDCYLKPSVNQHISGRQPHYACTQHNYMLHVPNKNWQVPDNSIFFFFLKTNNGVPKLISSMVQWRSS